MYMPPYFDEPDRETLYRVIRDNNFGVLVTADDGAPYATHLPFLLEGALQGCIGAGCGMGALLVLFNWITLQFAGPAAITLLPFVFFDWPVVLAIVGIATLLCVVGSFSAIRRFLHL